MGCFDELWFDFPIYGRSVAAGQATLPSVIAKQVQKWRCVPIANWVRNAMFIEGCEAEWEALPPPPPPLTVGVDGGYVRGREGKNRKFGNFEVIVGKSMPGEGQGPT